MTRLRDLDAAWFDQRREELCGMDHCPREGVEGELLDLLEHAVSALREIERARPARVWGLAARALDREVGGTNRRTHGHDACLVFRHRRPPAPALYYASCSCGWTSQDSAWRDAVAYEADAHKRTETALMSKRGEA